MNPDDINVMNNEDAPESLRDVRQPKCSELCQNYLDMVSMGVFRKKTLSANWENLLKTQLKRCLGLPGLVSYGLASMLGGSIYVLTGVVMRKRTGAAVFLAYLLAGVVALLNAMIYSELACRIPMAGSSYSYAYVLLGELIAFLTGWFVLLEYVLGIATVTRGWSSMLDGLTGSKISTWVIENVGRMGKPGGFLAEYPDFIGAFLIIFMSTISCLGVQGSSRVTGVFILINVLVLFIIATFMFIFSKEENLHLPIPSNINGTDPHSPSPEFLPFGISGLVGGVAICFNAFIGFDAISTCAEEAEEPNKNLPRANFVAVFVVTSVTMTASLALAMYHPWYLISTEVPFLGALVEQAAGGSSQAKNGMFYFVGTGCLIGLTSSLLTYLIAGPRIVYSIALDGLLPGTCAYVSDLFNTPIIATMFLASITILLDILFSVESLADFLSLGTLIAYSMASIGILMLRYRSPPELIEKSPRYVDNERELYNDRILESLGLDSEQINPPDDPAERRDYPGYLKGSTLCLIPTPLARILNRGKPGSAIIILVNIFIILNALLIVVIKCRSPEGGWPLWRIITVSIFIALEVMSILLMACYKQFGHPQREMFHLPFVPAFPCVTLSVNMFLIAELSWITWVRFAIWTVIGLIIYFTYGLCSSETSLSVLDACDQADNDDHTTITDQSE